MEAISPTAIWSRKRPAPEDGVAALLVTNIKPLYLVVTYGSTSGGYLITIEQQAALLENKRHSQSFVSKETKSDLLTLNEVKGPPDKPDGIGFHLE